MKNIPQIQYDISNGRDGQVILNIRGSMDATSAGAMIHEFNSIIKARKPSMLTVDMGLVTYLDDFGALVLVEMKNIIKKENGHFQIRNASGAIQEMLSILNVDTLEEKVSFGKKPRPGIFIRLGDAIIRIAGDKTGLAMINQLPGTHLVCDDHREAGTHRLQNHIAEGVGRGGKGKDIC